MGGSPGFPSLVGRLAVVCPVTSLSPIAMPLYKPKTREREESPTMTMLRREGAGSRSTMTRHMPKPSALVSSSRAERDSGVAGSRKTLRALACVALVASVSTPYCMYVCNVLVCSRAECSRCRFAPRRDQTPPPAGSGSKEAVVVTPVQQQQNAPGGNTKDLPEESAT